MICAFSFCHLDSPMLFKDQTNDEILEVELFVREQRLKIIDSKKITASSENTMEFHFGPYANISHEFKFRVGDKKQIYIIIAHVKKLVETGDIGLFKTNQMKRTQEKRSSAAKTQEMSSDAAQTYYFQNKLNEVADQNANRDRGGCRYFDETKQFATYIRILAGRYKRI